MRIRRATDDHLDLDLVTALRLAFVADVRGLDPSALDADLRAATIRFVHEQTRHGTMVSWLAEDGAEPVGIVSVLRYPVPPLPGEPRDFDGYIINMYVRPDGRTRGTGRLLLDACLAGGEELDVRTFFLRATDDGLPLYERSGFTVNDRLLERAADRET